MRLKLELHGYGSNWGLFDGHGFGYRQGSGDGSGFQQEDDEMEEEITISFHDAGCGNGFGSKIFRETGRGMGKFWAHWTGSGMGAGSVTWDNEGEELTPVEIAAAIDSIYKLIEG